MVSLVENIQRQDLNPIEIALSYQRLIEEIIITQEAWRKRVGKNQNNTVTNYLRLLLIWIIQNRNARWIYFMGHGRAL